MQRNRRPGCWRQHRCSSRVSICSWEPQAETWLPIPMLGRRWVGNGLFNHPVCCFQGFPTSSQARPPYQPWSPVPPWFYPPASPSASKSPQGCFERKLHWIRARGQTAAGIFCDQETSVLASWYPPLRQVRAKAGNTEKLCGCTVAQVEPRAWAQLAGPGCSAPLQCMFSPAWRSWQQAGHRGGWQGTRGAGTAPQHSSSQV